MAAGGGLMGPPAGGDGGAGGGASAGGGGGGGGNSGLGLGCLAIVLTAQSVYVMAYLPNAPVTFVQAASQFGTLSGDIP